MRANILTTLSRLAGFTAIHLLKYNKRYNFFYTNSCVDLSHINLHVSVQKSNLTQQGKIKSSNVS